MTDPDSTVSPGPEPLDDARCLLVLGLLRDHRPVSAQLAAAARAHAAAHPQLARIDRELALLNETVAGLPGLTAGAGFTERVLASRRAPPQGITQLRLALRLAAAAALLLAVVTVHDATRPGDALADPDTGRQSFQSDVFFSHAFAAPDLDAGLKALLPGPLDRKHSGAPETPLPSEPNEDDR